MNTLRPIPEDDCPTPHATQWGGWKLFAAASGWIVALLVGLLEVPSKIVSFYENYPRATKAVGHLVYRPERFVGRWSSDPSAWVGRNLIQPESPMVDTGDVQLSVVVDDDGAVFGEIVSEVMRRGHFPYSRVMIDGKVGVVSAHLQVWDIVQNERAAYAGFKLRPEGGREGTLLMIRSGGSGIPEVTRLWRTDFEMGDGAFGEKWMELLRRNIPVGPDGQVILGEVGEIDQEPPPDE
ncbi:hypothetical protein OS187_13150 [Xanthomonadaceae bacterium JHOS43]|nr:hypothetical protein [Xanthomonadaceae bacterium JHOS43]